MFDFLRRLFGRNRPGAPTKRRVVSAWRLRLFPGKPSVSDDFLPKRQRNQWVTAK
jgi:hypothetical protein